MKTLRNISCRHPAKMELEYLEESKKIIHWHSYIALFLKVVIFAFYIDFIFKKMIDIRSKESQNTSR